MAGHIYDLQIYVISKIIININPLLLLTGSHHTKDVFINMTFHNIMVLLVIFLKTCRYEVWASFTFQ